MLRKLRKVILFSALSQFLALSLSGCLATAVEEGETTIEVVPDQELPPPGTEPVGGTVCNPFGGGSAGRDQGLKGELFYLPPNLPHYQNVSAYIENGTRVDATLYFDQVNVPTRPFDAGFITTAGEVMKTPTGDTLYEWFGIRFESKIRLTNQDVAGKYQFALIADDGAVLLEKLADGSTRTLVNNDGEHATKFKIATQPVTLDHNGELPIEVRYYQGPRMHIAAMVLWREWPEGTDAYKDPLDGVSGNDTFFNSGVSPSQPQVKYQQLLARGWRPVPAANFFLPSEVPANPCPEQPEDPTDPVDPTDPTNPTDPVDPTDPGTENPQPTGPWVIQGFDGTTTANSTSLIWTTNGVATTTKVYYGLSATNLDRSVDLGSATTQVHSVAVTGLTSGTTYYFRAESRDANGKVETSTVIAKTTK